MADNITLNPGTGGAAVRTIDRAGVETQVVALDIGGAGAESLVSSGNPLPIAGAVTVSGVATAANQATGNTALGNILTALGSPLQAGGSVSISGTVPVSGPLTDAQLRAAAVPVSAASLPLPTGAATAAGLTTINTTLGSPFQAGGSIGNTAFGISGTLPAFDTPPTVNLGTIGGAATAAAQATGNTTLASIDADIGALTDAAALANGTGDYSLIAAAKRALLNWANLLGRIPAALGQTTMAGSLPVALASDHSPLNVRPDNVADNLTTTGTATSATTLVSVSTAGFQGGSFQVTNPGTTCTVTYEQSNDNTNWVPLVLVSPNSPTNAPVTTSTAAIILAYTTAAAFVRARVSTYGSGTVAITLNQKRLSQPYTNVSLGGSTAALGTVTLGAGAAAAGSFVIGTGSAVMGNIIRQSGFTDSTTALAAGATFTGTGRVTTNAIFPRFVARAVSDQSGTLLIEHSLDTGATYHAIASAPTALIDGRQVASLSVDITGLAGTANLLRVRYVNGATLQTLFRLSSALSE